MTDVGASESVKFTCLACRVGWPTLEQQRAHYRTDWHRYNLKRKVASMAPVTADEFRTRVISQKSVAEQKATESSFSAVCDACGNKHFSSKATYESHVNSKKHKDTVSGKLPPAKASDKHSKHKTPALEPFQQAALLAKAASDAKSKPSAASAAAAVVETAMQVDEPVAGGVAAAATMAASSPVKPSKGLPSGDDDDDGNDNDDAMDEDEDEEDEDEEFVLNEEACLFCNHHSASLEDTLIHMTVAHSFIIPELQYLVDLREILTYLQEKVYRYFVCLKCNGSGRGFHSASGVQKHMVDKGHCVLDFSDERGQPELAPFYDFRPSYPDYVPGEDDDDEWEDLPADDNGDDDGDDDGVEAPSNATRTLAVKEKPFPAAEAIFNPDTLEIALPGGTRTIGHRSMLRYYKQKFRVPDQRESVQVATLMHQYKTLAEGTGKLVKAVSGEARRERIKFHKQDQYARMKLGVKHNKFQFYFREQLLQ